MDRFESLGENGLTGRELRHQGLLEYVEIDQVKAINDRDKYHTIGTSALMECAGVLLVDSGRRVAGVTHVSFDFARRNWVDKLENKTMDLVKKANSKGGRQYHLRWYNVTTGRRDYAFTREITQRAQKVSEQLKNSRKISQVEYLLEEGFAYDLNDGLLPYY
ncbi:hypothetical protein HY345_00740 [Candidatus Microgenomates bacterium]|nr:hypothetical protein [Candidatus Microgenomates bacterium]